MEKSFYPTEKWQIILYFQQCGTFEGEDLAQPASFSTYCNQKTPVLTLWIAWLPQMVDAASKASDQTALMRSELVHSDLSLCMLPMPHC